MTTLATPREGASARARATAAEVTEPRGAQWRATRSPCSGRGGSGRLGGGGGLALGPQVREAALH